MPDHSRLPSGEILPVEVLTDRMAKNDEDAWSEFHKRYYRRLHAYVAMLHGSDDSTTSECVQLASLRIVRHIKKFESEARFWNWLACLAKCATIDYHRGRTRQLALLEKYTHWKETQRATERSASPLEDALDQSLNRLSPEERTLFEGKYLEEQTYAELAERHQLTEKAVENRLARLRQKLRDSIMKDTHCYVA